MFRILHRALVRQWLRQFRKKQMVPSVRAVFLGDAISTQITLDGLYERFELDALAKDLFPKLAHPSTCLDIGANIGNHSTFFSKHFQKVVSFEPNPMVYSLLTVNIMGRNVTALAEGLSTAEKTLWFRQDFANLGASHIVEDESEADFSIKVRPLDDVVAELGLNAVSFVKIDAERHEPEVLRGGMNFLKAQHPVIAMEAFFESDPTLGREIAGLLAEAGYRHFYRLAPVSDLIRRIEDKRVPVLLRGILRAVLPERMRKTVRLEKVGEILGRNHQLLICAHAPLDQRTRTGA